MSTALEHARMAMKAAVKALEGDASPTLEDVRTARDLAKSAHETLKAGYDLLSKGINQVMQDEDPAPSAPEPPPMFDEHGAATPEADLTVPSIRCAPYPDHDAMDVEIVANPAKTLDEMLNAWETFGFEEGRSMRVFIPIRAQWFDAFNADPEATLDLLRWTMDNTANCWVDPKCAEDLRMPGPDDAETAEASND